ncbi:MAG: SDR family oxidoreductase [Pseudomonadota bacterium]
MRARDLPLTGKVALVTGGAGGLGRAICHALANEGARVVVGYNRSADAAWAVAASLPNPKCGHAAAPAPVTDTPALGTLAEHIAATAGRLDILVNCAGTTRFVEHADLDALDDALIDDILATNVRGPLAAVRALRPLLRANGDGLVINISSIAASTAMGSNIMYCASKAALDNMTKSLARALAPAIRVVSIAPGLVDTDFVRGLDSAWRDSQAARTPLQRLAEPDEIARAVSAVATHLTFSTGTVIAVDGGRPLA